MNKINQLNENLLEVIKKYGCNLLSHIGIVTDFSSYEFSVEQINNSFQYFLQRGYVNKNCAVIKPNEIMNYFFAIAKSKKRGFQVGSDQGYWKAIAPENQFTHATILKYKTRFVELGSSHYIQGNAESQPLWDPMQGKVEVIELLGFLRYQIW